MANVSNARGICIMLGESEQLATLYSLMEELKGVTYSTDIFECYILDCSNTETGSIIKNILNGELPTECVNNLDIDNLIKKVSSNKFVLVSEFQGSGRWSYSNNIEHLLYWLGLKLLEKGSTVPNSLEGVELTFIYVDEECGCTHLAHEQYTIKLELDRDHLVQKKN